MKRHTPTVAGSGQQQAGAVLIIALLLLLALTVVGLQGIRSTAVVENMAGNRQDADLAFQAAESGLAAAYNDILLRTNVDSFDAAAETIGSGAAQLNVDQKVDFVTWTPPPVGSGYDADMFRSALFSAESVGTTASGIERRHAAGYYRIGPRP